MKIQGLIEELINEFSISKLAKFFQSKNSDFKICPSPQRLFSYEKDQWTEINQIGALKLKDGKELLVFSIKTSKELTERSSKKAQFELSKRILIDQTAPCGIFVFYDNEGNFRFSLVYAMYSGIKAIFSHYRRHTYYIAKRKPYRTFLKALESVKFDTLKDIISAFSTQPLTKEFYSEIQNWYAWALDYCYFPGGSREENLIRLLTRLIFVWFLKERKLIPEEIFDPAFLKGVVKDFGKGNHYYNVILQNLFFATLNRYPQDRRFTKNGNFFINREEFGVKTLYRYRDKILISEEEFIKIFEKVPFVNGGLFECLDEDEKYIDGFTRREDKRAKLPDFLFFSEEQRVNLSEFYGERKEAKVRGLINILKDYNFTADESSPIDVEVSLDPELLGHIFENLLASYNPETQTTARKATGSYYTPKEIVDFMVEESLLEYFKTKTNIDEERLKDLLSYSENKVELTEEEKLSVIKAIDTLKVIDPAVGSGAFPMGIVHKLVYFLNKIDPDNKLWYDLQYRKALQEIEEVLTIKEKEEREKLLLEVNENFDESVNYPDYARKLYIIENSIYGVDIQPIAIQICKLRFFLSLLVDQKIDPEKPNYGVKPLPHLETKFVSANTLIGLPKSKQRELESAELINLKRELKKLYRKHFTIKTRTEKKRLAEKAKEIREKIKKILIESGWKTEHSEKIANFDIFSQTASADWFDPEWMFGVDDGFDIVIGNPPYVRQEKIKSLKPILRAQNYETFVSTADLYVYFYEKGYQLLKDFGILCFISSNKWMRAKYGENLRKFLKDKTQIIEIIDFGGFPVFEQTVDTCITLFKKQKPFIDWEIRFANIPSNLKTHQEAIDYIYQNLKTIKQSNLTEQVYVLEDEKILNLKKKIEAVGKPLKDWEVKIYFGIKTGYNEAFIIDTERRNKILEACKTEEERRLTEELIKPVLRGRDIGRYCYKWAGLWIIVIPAGWTNKNRKGQSPEAFFKSKLPAIYDHLISFSNSFSNSAIQGRKRGLFYRNDQGDYWWELRPCDYYSEFEKEKIVWQEIVREPQFFYDTEKYYIEATGFIMTGKNLKYIFGILNSTPVSFFFKKFYAGGGLSEEGYRYKKTFLEKLPIPPVTQENQEIISQIESLVDQILNLKAKDCFVDTSSLEAQIDQLVYELYGLTDEEIKIIEEQMKQF